MGDDPPNQADWMAEFKKVNKSGAPGPKTRSESTPSGSKSPGDRRKHNRFEIDECQATLYRDGVLTVFGVGKNNQARAALDLSEGGVRFLTHDRIPVGSKVRMIVEMEKYKDHIDATGEVRWCYQSAKNPADFFVGVEFQNLDGAQKRKISMMRDWFTSPQYRAVRETTKKRQSPK